MGSLTTKSPLGTAVCSSQYYGVFFMFIVVMIALSALSMLYLMSKQTILEQGKYNFDEGDIRWNLRNCIWLIFVGFIAGILSGAIGLGVGYTIGPIFIYYKVRPEISTVTCSFILCILSLTALTQYFVFGVINYQYGILYFCVGLLGALLGILGLRRLAISRGRASLLLFAAIITLIVAFIIFPSLGIYNAIQQSKNGVFQIGFTPICN